MLVLGIGLKFIPVVGSVSYLAGIELEDLPDGNYIVDGNGAYIIGGANELIVDGT